MTSPLGSYSSLLGNQGRSWGAGGGTGWRTRTPQTGQQPSAPGQTGQQQGGGQGGAPPMRPWGQQGQQSGGFQPSSGGAPPTFAQMQQQGYARPAPPPSAGGGYENPYNTPSQQRLNYTLPQQLSGGGSPGTAANPASPGLPGQLTNAISQTLASPSPFTSSTFQQLYNTGLADLNQQFGLQKQATDEDLARRGLSSSTYGANELYSLAGAQSRAMADLNASLLGQAATTQGQYEQGAISGALSAQQQQQQSQQFQQSLLGQINGAPTLEAQQLAGTMGNGAPTLAAALGVGQLGLGAAGLTGQLNGAPTLGAQQLGLQSQLGLGSLGLEAGGLTGQYGGAPTLAAQQLQAQTGLSLAGLTGQVPNGMGGGTPTLAAQQLGLQSQQFQQSLAAQLQQQAQNYALGQGQLGISAGQLTGQYGGAPTAQAQQFQQSLAAQLQQQAQNYALGQGQLAIGQEQAATSAAGEQAQAAYQQGQLGLGQSGQQLQSQQFQQSLAAQLQQQAQTYALGQGQLSLGQSGQQLQSQQFQQSLAAQLQQMQEQYGLAQGQLTGSYNGQQTLGAQQLAQQAAQARMQDVTANRGLDIQGQLAQDQQLYQISQLIAQYAGLGMGGANTGGGGSNGSGQYTTSTGWSFPTGGVGGGSIGGSSGGGGGGSIGGSSGGGGGGTDTSLSSDWTSLFGGGGGNNGFGGPSFNFSPSSGLTLGNSQSLQNTLPFALSQLGRGSGTTMGGAPFALPPGMGQAPAGYAYAQPPSNANPGGGLPSVWQAGDISRLVNGGMSQADAVQRVMGQSWLDAGGQTSNLFDQGPTVSGPTDPAFTSTLNDAGLQQDYQDFVKNQTAQKVDPSTLPSMTDWAWQNSALNPANNRGVASQLPAQGFGMAPPPPQPTGPATYIQNGLSVDQYGHALAQNNPSYYNALQSAMQQQVGQGFSPGAMTPGMIQLMQSNPNLLYAMFPNVPRGQLDQWMQQLIHPAPLSNAVLPQQRQGSAPNLFSQSGQQYYAGLYGGG